MQASTCECLGARFYITLSATVKLHAACSPLLIHYHRRFPPPSEPFIQIVLPRIPRQRRSEEEGGGEIPARSGCARSREESAGQRVGEVGSGSRTEGEEVEGEEEGEGAEAKR